MCMLFRGNSSKDFVYINTFNAYNNPMSWYFYYLLFNIQCAKLLQLCLSLCNPMDSSLPGSSVHGILQERILGNSCHVLQGSSWSRDQAHISFISSIGSMFFTTSATWEAHLTHKEIKYRELKCLFPGLMIGKAKDWQRIWICEFSLRSFHHVLLRKEKMKTEKTDGATMMTPRHRKLLNRPLGQLFLGKYTRDN